MYENLVIVQSMVARRARLSVGLLLIVAALHGRVPALASTLADGGAALVVEVVDGDTLLLDDGRQVRLVGIQAPKLPLGRAHVKKWPLADDAKAVLAGLTLNRRVRLSYGGRRLDRYKRVLAHLHDDSGRWIQGELLRRGMARVYSFRDNRALVPEMLALERAARVAGRGIWGLDWYGVRDATQSPQFVNSFQLVTGRVREVAVVRGRAYLNFGADWRSDFTVTIGPRDRKLFDREGIDYRGLAGRRIRVRGWLKDFNGPMIDATHPEQIEVLPE